MTAAGILLATITMNVYIFLFTVSGRFLRISRIRTEFCMNDKVIEILIHLLGHLKDHDMDAESLNEFSDGLVTRGYDEREVIEAIQWFLDKLNSRTVLSTDIMEQQTNAVRVLHEYERMNIAPSTFGYLLRLKNLGVVTGAQMERILDYFLIAGHREQHESEINEIVAEIIFEEYL